MRKILIPMLLVSRLTIAGGDENAADNYCRDQAAWNKIDALLKQFPHDHLVIRAYATRLGICRLIDEKKISLEDGIQMFDVERQRVLMERSMEDAARRRPKPLSEDDLEPVS